MLCAFFVERLALWDGGRIVLGDPLLFFLDRHNKSRYNSSRTGSGFSTSNRPLRDVLLSLRHLEDIVLRMRDCCFVDDRGPCAVFVKDVDSLLLAREGEFSLNV